MKHIWMKISTMLIAVALLFGCANNNEAENEAEEAIDASISITISEDEGEEIISEDDWDIEEGDVLMDVLKDHYDIEEDEGFIESIEGVSPEKDEEKAWMYFVNDEMAEVGAAEYEVEADDDIIFDLQSYE
ncbi:MAG TPA: DUF4430 domain-containing protein [Pseudogracilibacillus sp.]|nr:DUF4430 domain-containing protein [Pseudogracilibacillus sp.]